MCAACGLVRLRNEVTARAAKASCSGERPKKAVVSRDINWGRFS
jgi:hypothetical protein